MMGGAHASSGDAGLKQWAMPLGVPIDHFFLLFFFVLFFCRFFLSLLGARPSWRGASIIAPPAFWPGGSVPLQCNPGWGFRCWTKKKGNKRKNTLEPARCCPGNGSDCPMPPASRAGYKCVAAFAWTAGKHGESPRATRGAPAPRGAGGFFVFFCFKL